MDDVAFVDDVAFLVVVDDTCDILVEVVVVAVEVAAVVDWRLVHLPLMTT